MHQRVREENPAGFWARYRGAVRMPGARVLQGMSGAAETGKSTLYGKQELPHCGTCCSKIDKRIVWRFITAWKEVVAFLFELFPSYSGGMVIMSLPAF